MKKSTGKRGMARRSAAAILIALTTVGFHTTPLNASLFMGFTDHPDSLVNWAPYLRTAAVQPWTPQTAFLCVWDDQDTLRVNAWEGAIACSAATDNAFIISGTQLYPPSATNLGANGEFQVGLGQCVTAPPNQAVILASVSYVVQPTFVAGSLCLVGYAAAYYPAISTCGAGVSTILTMANLDVQNAAGAKRVNEETPQEVITDLPSGFPLRSDDALAGIGTVNNVRMPLYTTKGRTPYSLVTLEVESYFVGRGERTLTLVTGAAAHRVGDRATLTAGSPPPEYVVPGERIVFITWDQPAEFREKFFDPYPRFRRLAYAARILGEPSDLRQPTYRPESQRLTSSDARMVFNADGGFKTQYLDQVLVPTGTTLGELHDLIVRSYGRR